MRRRRYLRVSVGGLAGALAGCSGRQSIDPAPSSTANGAVASGGADTLELPVPRSELQRGAHKDAIPAITDPVFGADWTGVTVEATELGRTIEVEPRLRDNDDVVGIVRDGEARAYPLRVLNWHEIVNDEFGGPLLVTYCPLCGSAVSAIRRVNGTVTTFGVSGLLWRNDLVMYDEATESLWSQIIATAINGERTGDELELVPSTLTTLGKWRADHPDTAVLRPPPESGTVTNGAGVRDYTRDPYAGYESSGRVGIGGQFDDDRLHPKAEVLGIVHGDVARAYPLEAVVEADVINDVVDGLPVVVTVVDETAVAYVRRVDGTTLAFEAADQDHLWAGGSHWRRATGIAIDGPLDGTRLTQANEVSPLFWFAWLDFHPDTELYEA